MLANRFMYGCTCRSIGKTCRHFTIISLTPSWNVSTCIAQSIFHRRSAPPTGDAHNTLIFYLVIFYLVIYAC